METAQQHSPANHPSQAVTDIPVRALAVDDDRTMRMILQTQLEDLGHDVLTANDGNAAWEVMLQERDRLDVVLLDREMPEMNGLEVVAKMKKDPVLSNIPVIMQTGSDSPEQIREGIDAGVFYYPHQANR